MTQKTKLYYLTWLLTPLLLCHCGKNPRPTKVVPPNVNPPTSPPIVTPVPRTPESPIIPSFSLRLSPQPQPNLYNVVLSWDLNYNERKIWFVNRTDEQTRRVVVYTVPPGQRNFTDEVLEPNQSYSYSIGTVDNSEFKELHKQTIKIPLDLHIYSETTLTKIRGYNRVFLGKQANVHTGGEAFELETNELIAESGAKIEPFNSYIPTPLGVIGKDGALISIKAKKAVGQLRVFARGMTGGQGLKGSTGAQGAKGAKGADCNPMAPEGKQHAMGGEVGGPGYPGQQGYRGGTGGKNSPIQVEIVSAENFQLNLDQNSAPGGMGGEAGNGGVGGAGGEPGNAPNHNSGMCHWKSAPIGSQGASGPNGQPGPAGSEGQRNSVCLKINGLTEGTCQ